MPITKWRSLKKAAPFSLKINERDCTNKDSEEAVKDGEDWLETE